MSAPTSILQPTFLGSSFQIILLTLFIFSSTCLQCLGESISLFDGSDSLKVEVNSTQVQALQSDDSIDVEVRPGDEAYPGIFVYPREAMHWDLSGNSEIRLSVTNSGNKPFDLFLRVDNDLDWRRSPWNTEQATILPNTTEIVRVEFGKQYGFQPGYPLDPSRIVRLMIFLIAPESSCSFKINSIESRDDTAANAKERTYPISGYVFGRLENSFQPELQLHGADIVSQRLIRSSSDEKLEINLSNKRRHSIVSLHPVSTYWAMPNATAARIVVTNVGRESFGVSGRLCSEGYAYTDAVLADRPIGPKETTELLIPFQASTVWTGPDEQVIGVEFQGRRGTGTQFHNDRITSLDITVLGAEQAALQISSVEAVVIPMDVPTWVGKNPPVDGDWEVTFDENFDQPYIDESRWNVTGPNWWGIKELNHWSRENTIVQDGKVVLRTENRPGWHNDDPNSSHYSEYAGGYLDTLGKWTQRYGYFEARVKPSTAPGLWPAFWLLPDRGVDSPANERISTKNGGMEFDIMENQTRWGPFRYAIYLHWDDFETEHKAIGTTNVYVQPDKDGFLTAGLLWLPGEMKMYHNGTMVAHWKNDRIGSVPSYIIFNHVIGGWDNDAINDKELPSDFTIDYVRVWQRKDLK